MAYLSEARYAELASWGYSVNEKVFKYRALKGVWSRKDTNFTLEDRVSAR